MTKAQSKAMIAPRLRKVRVLATLGPASSTPEMIAKLFAAGADALAWWGDEINEEARSNTSRWWNERFAPLINGWSPPRMGRA